jgi:hypothetical protein
MLGQDRLPNRQQDWPLPQQPRVLRTDQVQNLLLTAFAPTGAPFRQTDWQLPTPASRQAITWGFNLLQSTLAPPVVAAPFNQLDWPLPRATPRPILWGVPDNSTILLPPGPVVPVTPPTGGGERLPRGYRWNWRDFTDREWFKAFRQEFRRLKHLKNPQDRREQIEALEEALERAVDRALSNETPQEIMVGLEKAGEMLLGAPELGAPAFERIEMYLVALAAEIDDEEAFLLLDS